MRFEVGNLLVSNLGIPASQRVKAHHVYKKCSVGTSYLQGEGQRVAFIKEVMQNDHRRRRSTFDISVVAE